MSRFGKQNVKKLVHHEFWLIYTKTLRLQEERSFFGCIQDLRVVILNQDPRLAFSELKILFLENGCMSAPFFLKVHEIDGDKKKINILFLAVTLPDILPSIIL